MLFTLRRDDVPDAVSITVAAAGGANRLSTTATDFLTVLVEALPGGHPLEELLDREAVLDRPGGVPALGAQARLQAIRTAILLVVLSEQPSADDHSRLAYWARELDVVEPAVEVVGAIADGAVGLDAVRTVEFDVYRTPVPRDLALLPAYHRFLSLGLPAAAIHGLAADPRLASAFEALPELAPGTAGRAFADFYAAHNWRLPGTPGGVALPLTLHDWIHVYIGATTEPIGEVEVGAFATGCTRHHHGFNNVLIVLLMFEYGMVAAMAGGPGLTPAGATARRGLDRACGRGITGHPDGGRAVADALLRGNAAALDLYLGVDHLAHAGKPLADLRGQFAIPERGTFAAGLKPEY